jgi:hypothetical protein
MKHIPVFLHRTVSVEITSRGIRLVYADLVKIVQLMDVELLPEHHFFVDVGDLVGLCVLLIKRFSVSDRQ